jgi:hypothetical protein
LSLPAHLHHIPLKKICSYIISNEHKANGEEEEGAMREKKGATTNTIAIIGEEQPNNIHQYRGKK